jgi:hypothetical protein
MAGRRFLAIFVLVVAAGMATGLGSCGGSDGDRDNKRCERCDDFVNPGCFGECRQFCLEDDPECDVRCTAQCDVCRRDLVCGECRGDCTGTVLRCAPQNEAVTCSDGVFGGVPPVVDEEPAPPAE